MVQGIGGLEVGEEIRVVHLRSQLRPDGPRDIFVTVERAGGQKKEIKLNMGPGLARAHFEPL